MKSMKKKLKRIGTAPAITKAICECIWEQQFNIPDITCNFDTDLSEAIRKQRRIGVNQMRNGRMSVRWESAQAAFNKHNNTTMNSTWATNICQILIDTAMIHWTERNDELHSSKVGIQHERTQVMRLIAEMEKNGTELSVGEIVKKARSEIDNASLCNMKMWKKTLEIAMSFITQRMIRETWKNQKKISDYFARFVI